MAWWSWSTFSRIARLGREVEQRPVALVGLGHEPGPVAPHAPRCRRPPAIVAPDARPTRRPSAAQQHRAGGGLAVGARHGQPAPAGHQLGEQLGAVQHRQAAPPGLGQLGVVGGDRGRDDERLGVGRQRRRRRGPARASMPGGAQRGEGRRVLAVGAATRGSRPARASSARPLMPAPPMPTRWIGRGPLTGAATAAAAAAAAGAGGAARDGQGLLGHAVGGVGPAHRAGRLGHRLQAAAVGQERARPGRAGARRCSRRRAAPRPRRPPRASGRSWPGGRPWRGGRAPGSTGRPIAASSKTDPPEREIDQVGRRDRLGQVVEPAHAGGSAAPAVAGLQQPRASRRAGPGRRRGSRPTAASSPKASTAAMFSVRAPWLPPTTRMTVAPGWMPKARRPAVRVASATARLTGRPVTRYLRARAARRAGRPASRVARAARRGGWPCRGGSRPPSAAAGGA